MFDMAVLTFGRYIDNKSQERDSDGNLVNDLRDLLDIPPTKEELRELTIKSLRMIDLDAQHPERSGVVSDE